MLLCPVDSPGKNTGVDCHVLLQGIFQTQGSSLKSPALAGKLFSTSTTWEALASRRWIAKRKKKKKNKEKNEISFRRGHGPRPPKKAFISTIVFSSIIKAAWICYRKFKETHRKLKHPLSLKNYHFYDNSNLFLLYIPTCPHTHILIYMILKNKFEIFTHDSTFSHVISYLSKTLHYSLPHSISLSPNLFNQPVFLAI